MDPSKLAPTNLTAAMLRAARRSKWADAVANNPNHSAWYVQRFRDMAANGADLVGEARLIDAMAQRGSTILDAGCGPGRHAGYLHAAGHTVVGIDLDPVLIEAAEQDFPGPRYVVGDLADVVLPEDAPQQFDLVFSAGHVMGFLHPDTRRDVLMAERGPSLDNGSTFAWVVTDGVASRRPVQTGAASLNAIEIRSGLQAGDRVLVSGAEDFKPDERVRIH